MPDVLFWYAGVAAALVYVTLGRRRIDYRMILVGALLPGIVDAVGSAAAGGWPGGRGPAHSFLAPVLVAIVVLVVTRGPRRLSLFGVAVGWLFHLVADGMWQFPRSFLWPAFGWGIEAAGAEAYPWEVVRAPAQHASTWLKEVAGAVALVWFVIAFRLRETDRRKQFLRDGLLRA